jgi:hypothetical protein
MFCKPHGEFMGLIDDLSDTARGLVDEAFQFGYRLCFRSLRYSDEGFAGGDLFQRLKDLGEVVALSDAGGFRLPSYGLKRFSGFGLFLSAHNPAEFVIPEDNFIITKEGIFQTSSLSQLTAGFYTFYYTCYAAARRTVGDNQKGSR